MTFLGPRFYAFDSHILFGLSFCLLGFWRILSLSRIYREVFVFLALSIIPLSYILVLQVANSTFFLGAAGSYSILKSYFYVFVAVGVVYSSELIVGRNRSMSLVCELVTYAAALNGITAFFMLDERFRSLAHQYIDFGQNAATFVSHENRFMDIGIGGTDAAALAYCGFFVVALYTLGFHIPKFRKNILYFAIVLVALMSVLFALSLIHI